MIIQSVFEAVVNGVQWLMEHLVIINIFLSIAIVFFERRDPQTVWAWLLVLYFIPIVGIVFYFVLGQDFRKKRMFRMKEVEDAISSEIRHQEEDIVKNQFCRLPEEYKDYEDMILYNLESGSAVFTEDNQVEVYTDGMEKFQALAEELKRAEHFIHMQYYIMKSDEAFDMLRPILEEKARCGVRVRILFDSMGCRKMRKRDWRSLKEAGVELAEFFPAKLKVIPIRINYRNHRKIVVIDDRVGFVGGFNVGREYLGMDEYFQYWRDTHLKLNGSAVRALNVRFVLDWNFVTKQNLFEQYESEQLEPVVLRDDFTFDHAGIQIVSSGPDSMNQTIRDNYIRMIHKAKKSIFIQTPYFVPDQAVLSAIQIAAMSGVDVRVMIPCKPDHMFVYWATYSYINDLLEAGAQCYTYDAGFLHAKVMTIDGMIASVGTANMDIRSFKLNFEVNALIYDKKVVEELEKRFEKDIEQCTQITSLEYGQRSRLIRFKEQVSRLLSPLM